MFIIWNALPRKRSPQLELVPEQEFLTGFVSTALGPIEYRNWKKRLERIDEILKQSGAEARFQLLSLKQRNDAETREAKKENRPIRTMSAEAQANFQRRCSQVLRCVLAQTISGDDFRGFACRLSESPVLQWFCKLDHLEDVKIPGKIQLQ